MSECKEPIESSTQVTGRPALFRKEPHKQVPNPLVLVQGQTRKCLVTGEDGSVLPRSSLKKLKPRHKSRANFTSFDAQKWSERHTHGVLRIGDTLRESRATARKGLAHERSTGRKHSCGIQRPRFMSTFSRYASAGVATEHDAAALIRRQSNMSANSERAYEDSP